ncbi:MAG: PD-(D/E)XK nuclease family protein [Proteiniphilum sp.]|nr:PD-(D/E)XK nuclease family protein [Proteiniphilum sp.]
MTNTQIKNFFSLVATKKKLVEQIRYLYGKELAINFNSFDFWSIDENKVSEIIAFFLNPDGCHEQGDAYLRLFLKKFDLDFFNYSETDKISVHCESSTENNRRIDIVIVKNNYEKAIGIENKIYTWTQDQHNQINDYYEYLLEKTNGNFCLIYLSPASKEISNESISKENRFQYISDQRLKQLTYEDHLIECIREFGNITQNYRVKSFLCDFEKKLKKMYMGEENVNSKQVIKDLILENKENIEISFLVANSLKEVKYKLKEKFNEQIEEIGRELNIKVEGIYLVPSKWSKHKIGFSFESGGIICGVKRITPDINRSRLSEIENIFQQQFMVSEWWPMYQFFYSNIEIDKDFWIDVSTGRAKERAKDFIKAINDKLNNENY